MTLEHAPSFGSKVTRLRERVHYVSLFASKGFTLLVESEGTRMSSIGFVGPVKDVDAFKAFSKEINGARKAEHREACLRHGTTKQRVFLAQTPMGAMLNVYSEGLNAGFFLARLRSSSNAFDKFYLESVIKMTGMNFTELPAGPPPNLAFEWANGKAGKASTMIGMPVPDAAKFWQFCRDITLRYDEHSASREKSGITLERAFYMHDAKMVAVYLEGDDPAGAMEKSFTSSLPYDKWFAEHASAVHGVDISKGLPPRPELYSSFDA